MKRWRDGDAAYVGIGGTGSISCRPITEEQALEAQRKRGPLGFTTGSFHPDIEGAAKSAAFYAEHATVDRSRVSASTWRSSARPLAQWGEASWTAADLR